jgi:hypothetical protein
MRVVVFSILASTDVASSANGTIEIEGPHVDFLAP